MEREHSNEVTIQRNGSIECVHLLCNVDNHSKAKYSCSYPELRSLCELSKETCEPENAGTSRPNEGTNERRRNLCELTNLESLNLLCNDEEQLNLANGVPSYHELRSGSQNSSTAELDQIVYCNKAKFDSFDNGRIKTGVCFSADCNYTHIERNLSSTELSPILYQQTSPFGKHSNSTSLPHNTCSSIISSYQHGAKKQLKVAFAKDSPTTEHNRTWRQLNRSDPSGQAIGDVANSRHNLQNTDSPGGFLSASKYRKMEPLILPSVILLAWAVVITAQMQHSTFDRGQSGIFTRDSQQSTLTQQPLLHQPVVRHPSSRPDQFGSSDKTPAQVDVNDDYCSAFQGSCHGLESNEKLSRRYLPVEVESFQAFEWLHAQIDDDKDGELNARETGDFLAEELQAGSGAAAADQRHATFHSKHDSHISLQELWDNWQLSAIHNWTVSDVAEWLTDYVELPQYIEAFGRLGIDGKVLPRLCVAFNNSLLQKAGVISKTHQRKIAVKATDVVLFGIPKKNTLLKDAILLVAFFISLVSCWYLYWQYNYSQRQLKQVMKDLSSLQLAEDSLKSTQDELAQHKKEKAEFEQSSKNVEQKISAAYNNGRNEIMKCLETKYGADSLAIKLAKAEEENTRLKTQLEKLENLVRQYSLDKLSASNGSSCELPPLLVEWLQVTYEVELKHFQTRKKAAEQQLEIAKQHGEKLTRKRNTFIGALQVAHGSGLSGIDNEIIRARTALTEVTNDLQERTNRWRTIEALIGRPITRNSGLKELKRYISNYEGIIKSVNSSNPNFGVRQNDLELASHARLLDLLSPPVNRSNCFAAIKSASQPNFASRSIAGYGQSFDSTTEESSVHGSGSTAINTNEKTKTVAVSLGSSTSRPLTTRQPVKSKSFQNGPISLQVLDKDSRKVVSNCSGDILSSPNNSVRVESTSIDVSSPKRNSYSSGGTTFSKSTVSFGPESVDGDGNKRLQGSDTMIHFQQPGNGTDESTSLCSLSALSHLSSDAINSVPQSPQYPPRKTLRHSATFDEGTKSMSEKANKKKKSKNLFKRLLNSSNSSGSKGKAANVTFYQSQLGIPERTSITDEVNDAAVEPKDYSKDVSTL